MVIPTRRHPDPDPGLVALQMITGKKTARGMWSPPTPFFTNAYLESSFVADAPTERGVVTIEAYVCYDMIMHLPFISNFIPSPFRIHAYTVMPAPEAIPTPTPIPSP